MVAAETLRTDFRSLVDPKTGTVERRIFSDREMYNLELERIFARAWNFMAHESQIPNVGDFFLSFIGEDRVIVVRDKSGQPQVLLNTCRHRGNAVCRAEEGHATSFMCTYHGWTFDLQGKLVGVPGFKDYYHEDLKREEWGLVRAAQVDSYKGFVFATLDPEAPSLTEFLGEVGRMGLSLMAEHGDIRIVPGIQKYAIGCNWKLAVDNIWDWYHVATSHASATMAGYNFRRGAGAQAAQRQAATLQQQMVVFGEYGHCIGGPRITEESKAVFAQNPAFEDTWRERPEARHELGGVGIRSRGHPNIFPNLWVASGGTQLCLRLPKGPFETELWWFTLVDRELPDEKQRAQVHNANHTFGPAGMLEQDDGENWDQSTRAMRGVVTKRYPIHYAMGLGHDEVIDDETGPPHVETAVNEHAQLWHYQGWADWMAAESWADLKAHHAPLPVGIV